jgi:hypothetical protein
MTRALSTLLSYLVCRIFCFHYARFYVETQIYKIKVALFSDPVYGFLEVDPPKYGGSQDVPSAPPVGLHPVTVFTQVI